MTTKFSIAAALSTLLYAGVGFGQQQPPNFAQPQRRPVYSPYLNLTRPGGGVVQNYYGLVRPELEFRRGISNLQQQQGAVLNSLQAAEAAGEPTTGHTTGFLNHQKYFGVVNAGRNTGAAGSQRQVAYTPPAPRRR